MMNGEARVFCRSITYHEHCQALTVSALKPPATYLHKHYFVRTYGMTSERKRERERKEEKRPELAYENVQNIMMAFRRAKQRCDCGLHVESSAAPLPHTFYIQVLYFHFYDEYNNIM